MLWALSIMILIGAIYFIHIYRHLLFPSSPEILSPVIRWKPSIYDPRFGTGVVHSITHINENNFKLKMNFGEWYKPQYRTQEYNILEFDADNWSQVFTNQVQVFKHIAKDAKEANKIRNLLVWIADLQAQLKLKDREGVKEELQKIVDAVKELNVSTNPGYPAQKSQRIVR